MNTRPSLLLIAIFLALATCARDEATGLATAVPHQPAPAATAPPSHTPVAVGVATAVATATVSTPVVSPSPLPVLAGVDSMGELPEVPYTETVVYHLHKPSPELMQNWLRLALAEKTIASNAFQGLQYPLGALIQHDLTRHYPSGLDIFDQLVTEIDLYNFLREDILWSFIPIWLVNALNQAEISLQAAQPVTVGPATFTPQALDLDKDGLDEWMLILNGETLPVKGVIPLQLGSDGLYHIIPNDLRTAGRIYFDSARFSLEYDFNGDGVLDILQSKQSYFLGGTNGTVEVYAWDGVGIYALDRIDITVGAFKPLPLFAVADFTGDGIADVQITTPHYLNLGCEWDEVDIYSWPESQPEYRLQDNQPPEKPECLLLHAITPLGNISKSILEENSVIALLERGLSQFTIESAPSADYLALGYLHLAAAYAANRDDAQARQTISQLDLLPTDAPFVRLLKEIYAEEGQDVVLLCERLYNEPELAQQTDIAEYIYEGSVAGFFGAGSEMINADAVCPYERLIQGRLSIDEQPPAEPTPTVFAPDPAQSLAWHTVLYEEMGQNEWEIVAEVQTAVLHQTDPAISTTITNLLYYLPGDEPEARSFIEHLTYLLGYHYELNGDEVQAVNTYLSLIRQNPASPWSWLAWARLDPANHTP